MTPPEVAYSYGGGVQSTAMLVLAAQGHLPQGPFLFANVVRQVSRWLRQQGCGPEHPVRVGIGYSTDEWQRASDKAREHDYEEAWYPLLHLEHRLAPGRTGLDRSACARLIADAGLPVPQKSSCFFCPFHKPTVWADQARDEPDLFEKSCQLEESLTERRVAAGKVPVFLSRFGKPLREVFGGTHQQGSLLAPGWDEDEGYRCGDVCDT